MFTFSYSAKLRAKGQVDQSSGGGAFPSPELSCSSRSCRHRGAAQRADDVIEEGPPGSCPAASQKSVITGLKRSASKNNGFDFRRSCLQLFAPLGDDPEQVALRSPEQHRHLELVHSASEAGESGD